MERGHSGLETSLGIDEAPAKAPDEVSVEVFGRNKGKFGIPRPPRDSRRSFGLEDVEAALGEPALGAIQELYPEPAPIMLNDANFGARV